MTEASQYSPGGTTGGRVLLQRRVALFGLVAAGLLLFAFLCRSVLILSSGTTALLREPGLFLHLLAAAWFVAVWALTRGRDRSPGFVRAVEQAGLLLGCVTLSLMGLFLPAPYRPELIVTLALTQIVLARAVFVPSSARRTLVLGLVVGVALLVCVLIAHLRTDPVIWRRAGGEWSAFDRGGLAAWKVLVTAFWWAATLVVGTAASHVIFGLRERVDEARKLGQYTLEEKLGEGAMGMVFKARHAMLRRPTAIKLLLPDKVGEQALLRFEREVQMTARLTHPHTVTIYDYGRTPDGVFYYAMELLDGAPLDTIVRVGGPQPPERVTYIVDQVAAALAEAHAIGLIHRDIKPQNIMLTRQGGEPDVAKVLDFGLVKDVGSDADPRVSRVGSITGTPLYMSPETIIAYREVDARSDLYSLGAVAYFLLTGHHVFGGESAGEICTQHINAEPVPPSERVGKWFPPDVESLVLACLAKEPAERPQTASHLRARLWASRTYGKWNTDLARRWWRKHDAELAREKADGTRAAEVEKTIAIDLRHDRQWARGHGGSPQVSSDG